MGKQGKNNNEHRLKAEKALAQRAERIPDDLTTEARSTLIHELRVHQIQLEMQNDELRRAQEELENSRSKYANLYDFAPVGYLTFDRKGLVLEANITGSVLLGIERAYLISKPFSQYIENNFKDKFYIHIHKVLDTSAKQTCEIRLSSSKGVLTYALLESIKAYDTEGNPVCRTSVTDISSLKTAEENLLQESSLRSALLDNMPFIALTLKKGTREIVASNKVAAALGAVPGTKCYEMFTQRDSPCLFCRAPEAWATGKPVKIETKYMGKYYELIWVPLTEDLYVHYIMDITERRNAETRLQEIHKLDSLGVLAGGIAHDFNNILADILNKAFIVKMSLDKSSRAYDRLTSIENAVERATKLTKQFLTFSKGGLPIKKIVSIAEIVKESVEFALKGSNVQYEYYIADNIWPVEADDGQMNQVIHNLTLNAAQAMPLGGTLNICVENCGLGSVPLPEDLAAGKYVRVVIQDEGAGIPKEHLQKIFDPYFTTKQMGQGLGLSIVHSIIKKHGGTISVESEVGAGTTFTIYLPASERRIKKKPADNRKPPRGDGKILIMDDDEAILDSTKGLLSSFGYSVDIARTGEEAVELFKKAMATSKPYDAVILDLTVRGGMGGEETVRLLHEIDPEVKAIVSSGYSNDPVLAHFKGHGFKAAFAKSSGAGELLHILKRVLKDEQ